VYAANITLYFGRACLLSLHDTTQFYVIGHSVSIKNPSPGHFIGLGRDVLGQVPCLEAPATTNYGYPDKPSSPDRLDT
jgi:hypothetical protein